MSTRATATEAPQLELHDGHRIPQLGFGVFQVDPPQTTDVVLHALATGYRSIDTAAAYENEAGVGEAIARSGISREEVFVTTKLWNDQHGRQSAKRALEQSLQRLQLEHVDLYLIHWPAPQRDRYVETWEALCELRSEGRTRSIGVSNFLPEHLDRIIEATGEVPVLNQIELHPLLQQRELRSYHAQRRILTEAWSPLAKGGSLLRHPTITQIAQALERTPAQVVLRWHIQLGNVVIPKSVTPQRIEENYSLFDFELDAEQMQAIERLDAGERTGPDPASFG
jgi:2,5-diketo-D-gluconate reductase A